MRIIHLLFAAFFVVPSVSKGQGFLHWAQKRAGEWKERIFGSSDTTSQSSSTSSISNGSHSSHTSQSSSSQSGKRTAQRMTYLPQKSSNTLDVSTHASLDGSISYKGPLTSTIPGVCVQADNVLSPLMTRQGDEKFNTARLVLTQDCLPALNCKTQIILAHRVKDLSSAFTLKMAMSENNKCKGFAERIKAPRNHK
jgi:hypothetical protein